MSAANVKAIEDAMHEAIATSKAGPKAVQQKQLERLQALVQHARTHSRLYAAHYKAVPQHITDVRQLPPVTRAQLQGNFDQWVTDPEVTRAKALEFVGDKGKIGTPFLGKYYLWTTSGITGEPGLFMHPKDALCTYQGLSRARLTGPALGAEGAKRLMERGARMAVVYATGHHFGGIGAFHAYMNEAPELYDPGKIKFIPVQLPWKEMVQQLNDFDPAFLVVYTNSGIALAKEQAAGRLKIDPVFILTAGEWYDPEAYRDIGRVWPHAIVRDGYGATECIAIAYGCKEGWLHVNSDWVILEPVELDHSPTPPGQASRTTLLTNLANKLLPLVRYDIGDRTTLKPDPCACGNPLPAIKLEGRRDEVLSFLSPSKQKVTIVPKALVGQIEQVDAVELYQIIQTAGDAITIRMKAFAGQDDAAAWRALHDKVDKYLGSQGLRVKVTRAPEAPHKDPRTGKFLHIWSTPEAKKQVQEQGKA